MTESGADRKNIVRAGVRPILTWALACAVMGIGLYLSGVFNKPRTGPLWAALLGGMIPWALAGAFTFPRRDPSKGSRLTIGLIWALAFLLSFGLVAFLANALPDSIFMLIMMLLGCAAGPGAGAFASTWVLLEPPRLGRSLLIGFLWVIGFLTGTWIGFFGIYAAPELSKIYIGSLVGIPAALTLGFGLGAAIGGFAASGIALGLTRLARKSL